MPKGIEVVVENGFATVDFVDRELAAAGLRKLLAVCPAGAIETVSRHGPRRLYRVPEGNARAAGLLDDVSAVTELQAGDTGYAEALRAADPRR